MKLINQVKKHGKAVTLHLKRHHKKYIFGILSVSLFVKGLSLLVAHTLVHNLSFANTDTGDNNDSIITTELDNNESNEDLGELKDGLVNANNGGDSENSEGPEESENLTELGEPIVPENSEEPENFTEPEEPIVPENSEEPENFTELEEPIVHENPKEPENFTEPEEPIVSENPKEPENFTEPEGPIVSENPEEPENFTEPEEPIVPKMRGVSEEPEVDIYDEYYTDEDEEYFEEYDEENEEVTAKEIAYQTWITGDLTTFEKAIQEVAYAYYMRGPKIQYNTKKANYAYFSPEEATIQNSNYLVCAAFTRNVYYDLGIKIPEYVDRLLRYTTGHLGSPEVVGYGVESGSDFIMRIYDSEEEGNYRILTNPELGDIIPFLRIGDVLTYNGHTLMVYDLDYDETGNVVDAILMQSAHGGGKGYVKTKLSGKTTIGNISFGSANQFLYHNSTGSAMYSDFAEGSLNLISIKDETYRKEIGTAKGKRNYSILRFVQENESGEAVVRLRYSGYTGGSFLLSNKTQDRLKFNKLFIEKTVSEHADDVVEPGSTMTYTIFIKNNSTGNYKDDLIITEDISEFVSYKTYTSSKNVKDFDENGLILTWNIGKLNAGEEFTIQYSVDIDKGNIGNVVISTGYVGYIPSAVIKNKIGKNLNKEQENKIKNSFESLKSDGYHGKELIDKVYKQSLGVDLNFTEFDITELIKNTEIYSGSYKTLFVNSKNSFSGMILNKYWNTLSQTGRDYSGTLIYEYNLKYWRYLSNKDRRADTIYPENFRTGDILIYTNKNDYTYSGLTTKPVTYESGEYAYIFIDGKFKGVNLGSDGISGTLDDRNEFTTGYYKTGGRNLSWYSAYLINQSMEFQSDEYIKPLPYQTLFGKDYYVILRPSLMIRNISYELNGGTGNDENPSAFILGSNIELKEPTKSGFAFKGWYTDSEYTAKVSSTSGLTDDVTLYAKWESNSTSNLHELTTFEKAFQEVAYAYYMRGPYMHYNFSKGVNDILSPEESTSQDYHYMTCTPFVMNVYKELLGIVLTPHDSHYGAYARDYVGKRPEVIGYGRKSGDNLYWSYGTGITIPEECDEAGINPTSGCIIKQLKIGDILLYAGHAMLVYDYVFDENGNIVDVYLIHSRQSNYRTKTKADHGTENYYNISGNKVNLKFGHSQWSRLGYNYHNRTGLYTGLSRVEGTVILEKLTEHKYLKFPWTGKSYYTILRLVDDTDGNSYLNFNGQWSGGKKFIFYDFLGLGSGPSLLYNDNNTLKNFIGLEMGYSDSVQSRLKYSKLYIEKTVDKKDNNIVEPDDELIYTIKIQNNSKKAYTGDLIVTEYIDTNLVEYKRTSRSGAEINGNQLQWNIGKLNSGDEIVIEYTVKVKTGHLGSTIESIGSVDNIPSGTIKNKIGKNLKEQDSSLIASEYNVLKGDYTGRTLINEIYRNVYGVDLGLDNLIITGSTKGSSNGLILYNSYGDAGYSSTYHAEMKINKNNIFSGMVLNSYFNVLRQSGFVAIDRNITLYEVPPLWPYKNPDNRANTIYPTDFKTGDILIYKNINDVKYSGYVDSGGNTGTKITPITYENGEYAYIYIDGKFVGINPGKDGEVDEGGKTGDDRNEFTTGYYAKAFTGYTHYWYKTATMFNTDVITPVSQIDIPGGFENWLQYQTLFGKDYYVVLRPSLMIRNISYELNGGTGNDENPSAFILGSDIELKEPTKTGYVFSGWYTDSEYTNQVTNTRELTDDVVLYAKWMSNCTFQGINIIHGNSLTVYSAGSTTCPATCITGTVTCNNGTVLGNTEYSNLSCSPLPVSCDASFTLTSTGSHGIYESCIPFTVSNNSCTPGITVYKLSNCANGYHTENGSGCTSNTKMVSCTQSGKPENSSYVTGNVQVTWNGERNNGGWSTADNCGWTCDSGYTQVGNVCRPELTTREKAFQEVAYAYYMRGPYIHYNSAKGRGHDFSPEEATSQDYNYLACGLYVLNVYRELLGHLSGNIITFPYDGGQQSYAKSYVGKRPEVIGYGRRQTGGVDSGSLYWWSGSTVYTGGHNMVNPDKSYIISQLKIGDILGYDGHVTMVYDYKYDENGNIEDVYLIHATDSPQYRVHSKLNLGVTVYDNSEIPYDLSMGYNKYSAIRYNYLDRKAQSEYHPDARVEGTVQLNIMSNVSSVLKFNTGHYSSHYYILRFVSTDGSGNSRLSIEGRYGGYYDCSGSYQVCSGYTYHYENKKIDYSDIVQSRSKYSKLYIEKTIDKWDNSVVGVDDELTYTIKIQNNSDKAYDDDLIVKENIDTNLVNYLSYNCTKNGVSTNDVQLSNKGNQLHWNIGQLNSEDEVIIEYTVKVKPGNIGETIESTGMVGGIPSGIITNTIGRNTDKGENLKNAYNDLKNDFTGKYLINEIYRNVYGVDLQIDKIAKINTTDQSDTGGLIYYNNEGQRDAEMRINKKSSYSGMVLNGYFNVLKKNINDAHAVNKSGDEITITRYGFPAIAVKSNDVDKRTDTIFPGNFQTGDILIYKNSNDVYYNWTGSSSSGHVYVVRTNTYENGEYAYIYIDGKFVGVNLGNDLTGTKDNRNEFTTNYYSNVGINSRYYKDGGVGIPQNIPGGFDNWLHYQSLFGKEAYVILRPSLMIRNITYELDGGTNNDENLSAFILGREVELKEPTKTGYVFSGWYTDSEYTTQVTNTNELTDDVVLYAKWENSIHELTTFEKAFQEVAYAYYMRGPYIHYNSAKSFSDILPPEESTSQDYHYMTCTPYVMNVYKELLGIVLTPADAHYVDYAKDYVGKRPEVIGYGEKSGGNLYWWDGTTKYESGYNVENPTQSYIISQLKIGDILHYAGHVMLVYDYLYDENGNIDDVYLLHSWGANYITKTKADHTASEYYYTTGLNASGDVIYQAHNLKRGLSPWSKLGYNYRDRRGIYEDSRIEGTVILQTLKEKANIDGTLSFSGNYKNNYVILRFVDDTKGEGSGLLNFDGQWTGGSNPDDTLNKFIYSTFLGLEIQHTENNTPIVYSDSVQSRLNYSKLYIEKTVDKKDNNIVEPDDELTYSIAIKNESKESYDDVLIVKENINTNLVEYLSRTSTSDIQLISNSGNQLQWNIGKLNSGDEVIIEYTVRVKTGHLGETIESTGLVDNIPSGTIKNKIGKNLKEQDNSLIASKYNELKSDYTGRALINEIYRNVYGVDLGLDSLIMTGSTNGVSSGLILYNGKWNAYWNTGLHANMYLNSKNIFSGMVLNSYFNTLRKSGSGVRISQNGVNIILYEIPALWLYENPDNRANTIYPTDFQTGDILIYTNENDIKYALNGYDTVEKYITYEDGEYAYIYIDGKFVGVNLGNDGIQDQKTGGDDRNVFITSEYYEVNNLISYTRVSGNGGYLETGAGCGIQTTGSFCIKKATNVYVPDTSIRLDDFLRYQSLFGKDAYVILRPSLMIRNITYELNGGTNNDENPNAFILGREVELKEPTKTGYVFSGWYTDSEYTHQVTNTRDLTDDVVLYAKWENTYTVTWKNRDGTVLETDENVEYGSSPEYNGSIPTRTGDAQYSYTFAGWSPATGVVQGDQTYTAQYTTSINEYLITFKNYDGSILQRGVVPYGDTPYYDGETPKKEPDQQYSYIFSEWTPEIVPVIGTATYTAQFNTVGTNEYTITLIVSPTGYGAFSQYSVVANYGSNIIFDGNTLIVSGTTVTATPRSNPKYTYSFSGRINSCGDILTHNCTITGEFTRSTNTYTVTWKNRDGTVLETDENVEYGSSPKYNGSIPTRTGDAQYSYTFAGWSPATGVVQGDVTYTAQYTTSINEYLITFKNYDGSILQSGMVAYGETPTYNGNTPSKEGGYEFSGWNPTIHPVNGIQVYTAMFRDIQGPTGEIIVSYLSGYLTNGCTSGNITLTLTGSDINGLATEPYKRDEGLWTTNSEKIFLDNAQGTGYIKDVAGNVTPIPYNITGISKTGLVISLDSPENGSILTGFVKLERAASIINPTCQALSGGYNIIVYSGTEEIYTGNTVGTSIDGTFQDGTYTWKVYATDILGHTSISDIWTFIINSQAPTCDIDYTPAENLGWTNGDIQSILSGCSQGTTGFNATGYLFTGNGTYEFTFRNELGITGNKIAHVRRIDKVPPYLQEVTPILTTTDTTPNYTFSSTESGTITYSGVCSSTTTQAISGNNTITLNALAVGTYSGCTITMTDRAGNISNVLNISEFKIKQSGGGGLTLKRDKCPGGDFSDSYYDGICENNRKNTHNAPNTDIGSSYQRGDEFIYDKQIFDSKYSDEMNQAYQYAYYYGITTKGSINEADVDGKLTRVAMAKMLSQYAINVLGMKPDNTVWNKFTDVSTELDAAYDNGVTLSYQLGIMGINMKDNKFRPYDTVSRAEFVTALSRLLYGIEDGKDKYYSTHIDLLKYLGIITNTDPKLKETRGYVMLMLMRAK